MSSPHSQGIPSRKLNIIAIERYLVYHEGCEENSENIVIN